MSSLLTNDHPYFLSQDYQESYLISHGTLFVYVLCFAKGKRRGRRASQRAASLLCVTSWLRRTVPISITL